MTPEQMQLLDARPRVRDALALTRAQAHDARQRIGADYAAGRRSDPFDLTLADLWQNGHQIAAMFLGRTRPFVRNRRHPLSWWLTEDDND